MPEPEEGAGFDAFLEQEEGKVRYRACENAIDNGTDGKCLPPDERVDGLGRYVVAVIDNDGRTKQKSTDTDIVVKKQGLEEGEQASADGAAEHVAAEEAGEKSGNQTADAERGKEVTSEADGEGLVEHTIE